MEMGNAEEECDERRVTIKHGGISPFTNVTHSFGYYESNQVGYISEVEDIDEPPKKKRGKPPVSTKGTAKEAKNFTARRRGAGRGQGSGEGIVGRRGSASRGKNRSRGADALLDDGEGGIQDSEYKDVGRMGYFEGK